MIKFLLLLRRHQLIDDLCMQIYIPSRILSNFLWISFSAISCVLNIFTTTFYYLFFSALACNPFPSPTLISAVLLYESVKKNICVICLSDFGLLSILYSSLGVSFFYEGKTRQKEIVFHLLCLNKMPMRLCVYFVLSSIC